MQHIIVQFFLSDFSPCTMHLLTCFTIITIAFLCSSVWGNDVENRAAYERVVECILINTHADQPGQNLPTETVICDAFKV